MISKNLNRTARQLPITFNIQTLTPRQQDIIYLLSQGCSNKAIAKQLSISHETVKSHLRDMFNKFNVDSRTTLVGVFLQATLSTKHAIQHI